MSPPIYTPDGSEVSEIVLPDGSTASEVIGPDGNIVFEAGPDIPDSVVAQYRFEDQTDPTSDAVGSNDASLFDDAGFNTSNPRCGSVVLDTTDGSSGTVGRVGSQNTIDLIADGTANAASVGSFVQARSGFDEFDTGAMWYVDSSNFLRVMVGSAGDWAAQIGVGGNFVRAESGVSISTSSYQHTVAAADATDLWIIVDGTEEARVQHGLDPTQIGTGELACSYFGTDLRVRTDGLFDNPSFANDGLNASEAQTLIDQC